MNKPFNLQLLCYIFFIVESFIIGSDPFAGGTLLSRFGIYRWVTHVHARGRPCSRPWSPMFTPVVTHVHARGHPCSRPWSPMFTPVVTHVHARGHPCSRPWSPMFTPVVTHVHARGHPCSRPWSPMFTPVVAHVHRTILHRCIPSRLVKCMPVRGTPREVLAGWEYISFDLLCSLSLFQFNFNSNFVLP